MGPRFAEFGCVSVDFDRLVSSLECVPTESGKNSVGVVSDTLSVNDSASFADMLNEGLGFKSSHAATLTCQRGWDNVVRSR